MAYAGQDYGSGSAYQGGQSAPASATRMGFGGMATSHAAGVIVIGAMAALWAIRMGFRGVNVGGVKVGV